jgi:hypothetical protein
MHQASRHGAVTLVPTHKYLVEMIQKCFFFVTNAPSTKASCCPWQGFKASLIFGCKAKAGQVNNFSIEVVDENTF